MVKKASSAIKSSLRAPIVVVVGHVDHGKTTLLDTIRKTNVIKSEHGGITQKIGAYQINIDNTLDKKLDKITFIDTPGHEAFTKIRSRGAKAADIGILVVAANDSVKPQTIEAIEHLNKAKIPIIVAMNKIDLDSANPTKVKKDLGKAGIQVEGFGGQVPIVALSAKDGTGIKDLLDTIILVASSLDLSCDPNGPLDSLVIDTRLDKGRGIVASVIVKNGTLKNSVEIYQDQNKIGKVRSIISDTGQSIAQLLPGQPAELSGFSAYPDIGSTLKDQSTVKQVSEEENVIKKPENDIPDYLKPKKDQEQKKLNVILKADTSGSIETIESILDDRIKVVNRAIGDINDADVLMAKSTGSIIIGFNVKASNHIEKIAFNEKVVYRIYKIIYELIEDLAEVVSDIDQVVNRERVLGEALIITQFPFNGQKVAGVKVKSGRLSRSDRVKIMRGDIEIGRARIISMRQGKNEVSKTTESNECGVMFDKEVDFTPNDVIIAIT